MRDNIKENIDWQVFAKDLLDTEKQLSFDDFPKPTYILLKWRKKTFIGSIQQVPHASKEIVILIKTAKSPLPEELVEAMRMLQPERLELIADDFLDIDGNLHILRRVDNRLTLMTTEQTEYMIKQSISIKVRSRIEK